jgi:NADP-dependent 3-hydroxy acid dehydrogenase YdfG
VNNAGWTTVVPHQDLDALTDEIFKKTFEVNVTGTWRLTKAAMPHLMQSEDGNCASTSPRSPACARSAARSPTRWPRPR